MKGARHERRGTNRRTTRRPHTPAAPPPRPSADGDLLDVTVSQLHRLYDARKYTVTQVVQWHLDRIDRYNGVYGAIETVFHREALADAAREDAGGGTRGPLWGVPIVIKANTSIKGFTLYVVGEGIEKKVDDFAAEVAAQVAAAKAAA